METEKENVDLGFDFDKKGKNERMNATSKPIFFAAGNLSFEHSLTSVSKKNTTQRKTHQMDHHTVCRVVNLFILGRTVESEL